MIHEVLSQLVRREPLGRQQATEVFSLLMEGRLEPTQTAALLALLAAKGPAVDEIVAAATVMRQHSVRLTNMGDNLVDTCGTGGDVKGTFNISTAAAIIAAAAGVRVVKHGNRSATSKCGSADVLEAVGVNLDCTPDTLRACLESTNICFAFARNHHPAMKHVAPVRAAMKIPTLFNILGPLTNPAGASRQVVGVYRRDFTPLLASALRELGAKRAWVVHADDGLDELSTMSPTQISELADGTVHTYALDAAELGLPRAALSELQVHSIDEAAAALRDVLASTPGPRRDIAMLNAAAVICVAGLAESLPAAMDVTREVLDSGAAARTLDRLISASKQ